jgi:hypothetical protein
MTYEHDYLLHRMIHITVKIKNFETIRQKRIYISLFQPDVSNLNDYKIAVIGSVIKRPAKTLYELEYDANSNEIIKAIGNFYVCYINKSFKYAAEKISIEQNEYSSSPIIFAPIDNNTAIVFDLGKKFNYQQSPIIKINDEQEYKVLVK